MRSNLKNSELSENAFVSSKTKAPKFNLRLKQPSYWNTPNPKMEEQLLQVWNDKKLLQKLRSERAGNAKYWLLDGPPYANGDAHLGHLLNKTLKDVSVRFANLNGFDTTFKPGWDTHGLPLELVVEKREGKKAKDNPVQFMSQCRSEANKWRATQAESMSRTGLLADMDNPWLTMDPKREASALELLRQLWKSDLLVERHSPVHWCPACQSALAASELEKEEAERTEVYFHTPLSTESTKKLRMFSDENGLQWPNGPMSVMSWTTTPWTLWANAGFGFPMHGTVTVATLATGENVLVATQALNRLRQDTPSMFGDLDQSFGHAPFNHFAALSLEACSPLTGLNAPFVPAEFATEADGTGFVHLAPAFGPEDFLLHESHGVRLDCHVGPNGRLQDTGNGVSMPDGLKNLTLEEGTLETCRLLEEKSLLVATMKNVVETNTCWRHHKKTFFRASKQFALDLEKPFDGCDEGLSARATKALEQTKFVPDDRAKTPLAHMLATRRFWTLSRNRLWGLPLPFFTHVETGKLHPETDAMWRDLVSKVSEFGVEVWQSVPTPENYEKSAQTVDVWFDSGAAWLTAAEDGHDRADLVVEGRDQTRGWFLSSFLLHAFKSTLPPFHAVMTHSFVVDENSQKLSKSKGGTPDNKALFAKYGADVFRMWVCSQNVGDETKWSKTSLDQASQDVKDWRSFLRFLLSNMATGWRDAEPEVLRSLDQLALEKLTSVRQQWHTLVSGGNFNQALVVLSQFRQWASTVFFDLSKRTLYCAEESDWQLKSAQWTLQKTFLLSAQMLSPFLPFATEEAYLAWEDHPKLSLFLHTLESWKFEKTSESKMMQEKLAWRRSLLPLVERAREYVTKGNPVCLGLPFNGSKEENEETRELFPGVFLRFDANQSQFESSQTLVDGKTLYVAGEPKVAYKPYRCVRCRGYFSDSLNTDDMCEKCQAEMS